MDQARSDGRTSNASDGRTKLEREEVDGNEANRTSRPAQPSRLAVLR